MVGGEFGECGGVCVCVCVGGGDLIGGRGFSMVVYVGWSNTGEGGGGAAGGAGLVESGGMDFRGQGIV